MKIVLSDATLMHGGAERVVSILANSLYELGHDVEILLFYDREIWYDINPNIKITISEKLTDGNSKLGHLIWRRKYIKNSGADVVVSFLAPYNMLNIVTMFGLKIPLIVADRNDPHRVPVNKFVRAFRDYLYRFADGIVLQSSNNRDYFSNTIRDKSAVIFNPVDVGNFEMAAVRCKDGEKNREIVCVGRVIKQKNPIMLFNAFSNIANDFPEYKLCYIGDGDMRADIGLLAEQKGLSDRVELNGPTTSVFERIYKSDIFVMTSDYEGMPNALIEAMCIGLPVISTKVSGATDVIDSGINGILVDCGDEKALENELRRVLSDNEIRKNLGQNAAKLASSLRVDEITQQWIEFIENIIRKRG